MKLEGLLTPNFEVHIVYNEKENYTKASGNIPSLLTALSIFVKALKENKLDDETIKYAVEQGLKSEKERNKELDKKIDEIMKKIFE